MKQLNPFMQTFENLPTTLPIFPLNDAVVMPCGKLPLNIFEPRYINMIQDSITSHSLIGMIQPRNKCLNSELFSIGCAARISRYEETKDGRIEILLTGLCRFQIQEELNTTRGYRLVVPNWSKFKIDYEDKYNSSEPNQAFINALKFYFQETNVTFDWNVLSNLNSFDLFHSLSSFIKLSSEDKQMLLEIDTTDKRIKGLTAILNTYQNIKTLRH